MLLVIITLPLPVSVVRVFAGWTLPPAPAATVAEKLTEPLKALGYEVKASDMNSGLHAIEMVDGGLKGAADPRREGIAVGR